MPVHGSRYLRSTVSVSSPVIDNSRSTTVCDGMLPRRASEIIANGLPINGLSPKLVFMAAKVGPGTFRRPPLAR